MTRTTSTSRRQPAPLPQQPEMPGSLSYILQGVGFIGVLVLLFVLAGFRG